jgi:threonylcarbamoyladenosine tRNA methylthiotransferase MtaB
MQKVVITTLGCKVNQFESAAFKTGFEAAGLEIVSNQDTADIVVINSCAVTGNAGAQSRKAVRRALRMHPHAEIIITGCYAEAGLEELRNEEKLAGRKHRFIGNNHKDKLVATTLGHMDTTDNILPGTIRMARDISRLPVKRFSERSRAYLRVQDGCESFCTYCIVPYTRGPSRSLPLTEVLDQARIFTEEGHREIVLTGIHLGNYGRDLSERENIISLLDALSTSTPEVAYRISSLEPMEIDDTLLTLIQARDNIQPHLHIPLQSGNDDILSRMGRRYTTRQFEKVIQRCRQYLPNGAIGIDILAGFPGETEEQFNDCRMFLESLDFTYLHVFPYSIRPGTVAADFKDQVPGPIKETRVAILRELSDRKKLHFYQSQLGRTLPVLVEGKRNSGGKLKGFTSNYINVQFDGPDSLLNSTTTVQLIGLEKDIVLAERTENHEN